MSIQNQTFPHQFLIITNSAEEKRKLVQDAAVFEERRELFQQEKDRVRFYNKDSIISRFERRILFKYFFYFLSKFRYQNVKNSSSKSSRSSNWSRMISSRKPRRLPRWPFKSNSAANRYTIVSFKFYNDVLVNFVKIC